MTAIGARTRRGFTLIELLTVTGIAIVLATLVVTAVFAAQEAARKSTCASNLAQNHKLMMIYTQSYGQFLPAFWHERWIGELGLTGGQWREDLQVLKRKPLWQNVSGTLNMGQTWNRFLALGGRTYLPPSAGGSNKGLTEWYRMGYRIYQIYSNQNNWKVPNVDDLNPLIPMVWNNFQTPGHYLGFTSTGGGAIERTPQRSSAQIIMCPSDASNYRCDQGGLVSYMGLAKYGWWHRNDCPGLTRVYEYHQIQEVTNPSRGILLAETEPGTWLYGGCG
ncbi:MAG: type II secretion system protein [Planctomycetes bacterium]|nr:type II secretion system protein [Planctomycetota bacterium]